MAWRAAFCMWIKIAFMRLWKCNGTRNCETDRWLSAAVKRIDTESC